MSRRRREERAQEQGHQDQDQEPGTDSEDELCHHLASLQCLVHNYQCGHCGQVHTGSHHWQRVREDQGSDAQVREDQGLEPVYTWVCEHCTRVWNNRQWDPWLKVPEQPPPSTDPADAAADSSSASQWLAAGRQSQWIQGAIDTPIPEDDADEIIPDDNVKEAPNDNSKDDKPRPDDNSKDDKPKPW